MFCKKEAATVILFRKYEQNVLSY